MQVPAFMLLLSNFHHTISSALLGKFLCICQEVNCVCFVSLIIFGNFINSLRPVLLTGSSSAPSVKRKAQEKLTVAELGQEFSIAVKTPLEIPTIHIEVSEFESWLPSQFQLLVYVFHGSHGVIAQEPGPCHPGGRPVLSSQFKPTRCLPYNAADSP